MKTVRFTFRDGKVSLDGEGFHGPACDVTIGKFLKALGGETEEQEDKPERWETEVETQQWEVQDA